MRTRGGFSAGGSSIDHMYATQQPIENKMVKIRSVYLAFKNLKEEYDLKPRSLFWKSMIQLNIPKKLLTAILNLYKHNTVYVEIKNKIGQALKTTKGLTSLTFFKNFLQVTIASLYPEFC